MHSQVLRFLVYFLDIDALISKTAARPRRPSKFITGEIHPDISLTVPLNFTEGGQKVGNLVSIFDTSNLRPIVVNIAQWIGSG